MNLDGDWEIGYGFVKSQVDKVHFSFGLNSKVFVFYIVAMVKKWFNQFK